MVTKDKTDTYAKKLVDADRGIESRKKAAAAMAASSATTRDAKLKIGHAETKRVKERRLWQEKNVADSAVSAKKKEISARKTKTDQRSQAVETIKARRSAVADYRTDVRKAASKPKPKNKANPRGRVSSGKK